MFGCYRRDEAADPDTYVAAITMVLSRYSAEVVEAATDPFSGLPSRKKKNAAACRMSLTSRKPAKTRRPASSGWPAMPPCRGRIIDVFRHRRLDRVHGLRSMLARMPRNLWLSKSGLRPPTFGNGVPMKAASAYGSPTRGLKAFIKAVDKMAKPMTSDGVMP
jgi:hypothetical protein